MSKLIISSKSEEIDNSIFEKKENIVFIQTGITQYDKIPSLMQPKYDSWRLQKGTGDLIFEGTRFTLTYLINSFLYAKKSKSFEEKLNEENYFAPYGIAYPPVFIFVFVNKITSNISNLITEAVGVDVFGHTHRKLYVIAIPIEYHKDFSKENAEVVADQYLSYLIDLLKNQVTIHDILSTFPGAIHFAQREQMEGDGDESDLRQSLTKGLKLSVAKGQKQDIIGNSGTEEKIRELKSEIVGKTIENRDTVDFYDEIACTVYAPQEIATGNEFLIQVFTHTYLQSFELDRIVKLSDDTAFKRNELVLDRNIPQGSKLDFQLSISGLKIEENLLSIIWNGKIKSVQFTIKVPKNFSQSQAVGKVLVMQDSIPIGEMKFIVKIIRPVSDWEKKRYSNSHWHSSNSSPMVKFGKAFISYASYDRAEVLKRVQMLNLVKLDFFQDLLSLEPGEIWSDRIYKYIDQCDIFFIFWSKAASESEWVKKETLYALKVKEKSRDERPEIIPVIIEGPPPAKPPMELSFIHFNDKFIYFINNS